MNLYVNKSESCSAKAVAVDDMILTKGLPTTAASKMLDGYKSLFAAEVVEKLEAAGYSISGKVNVGEFSIDMLGESSYFGGCTDEKGNAAAAAAELLKAEDIKAVISYDVNGMPRRAAALGKTVYIKPTYGTVSRFGTIPAACSGETVGVMASAAADCAEILDVIAGHDDKDGTSLPEEKCALLKKDAAAKKIAKIAVVKALLDGVDAETAANIENAKSLLAANGVEIAEIDGAELLAAGPAWNILMSAELCNNVSRYDGVKFGYRSPNHKDIDELYTNSRTEAFGELLKTAILFGSDTLSTENYKKVYDKALRVRRVMSEYFEKLFAEYDAVLMPACSKAAYSSDELKANIYLSYEESKFTAPASITGLPAVAAGGVQLVASAFSDKGLLEIAAILEKGGKL